MTLRGWPWLLLVCLAAGAVFVVFPQPVQKRLETVTGGPEEKNILAEVDQLINQSRFKEAENLLEDWLRRRPPDGALRPRALWRLSRITYHLSKNESKGLELMRRLADEHPQAPEALEALEFILARQAVRPETFEEAARGYSVLATRFPDHARAPEWCLKEARLRLKAGNFPEAEAALNFIINKYPLWPELDKVYDELAQAHLAEGQPEKAIEFLAVLLETWPDSPLRSKARGDLARGLEARGDYRAARAIYRELIAEYPENPTYKRRLELLEARIKGESQNAGQVDYNYRPPRNLRGEPE